MNVISFVVNFIKQSRKISPLLEEVDSNFEGFRKLKTTESESCACNMCVCLGCRDILKILAIVFVGVLTFLKVRMSNYIILSTAPKAKITGTF